MSNESSTSKGAHASSSSGRLMSWQRATALVPLALLSAGWTASLALPTTASAASDGPRLPDGTALPDDPIKAPASVTRPGVIAPGVPKGAASSVVASASTHGIPDAALNAYQRAAQVIDTADPSCNVDWTLIAAIGRVESDHGRYGNNTLGDDGVSRPGIYGIPLNGSNGTAQISDTDAGELDDDGVFDRAVGPMQFIPSTWSIVGVDGDGDGVRNPQDVDDAALATAVYLCSGDEDLSTDAGRRAAVYRYNHSQRYVDLVLSIMAAYASGDFSSVPNGSAAPATFAPTGGGQAAKPGKGGDAGDRGGSTGGKGGKGGTGGGSGGGGGGGTGGTPTSTPVPTGGGTGTGDPSGGGGPGGDVTDPVPTAGTPTSTPLAPVLTPLEQATRYCQQNAPQLPLQQCVDAYLSGGAQAVQALLAALTQPLPTLPTLPSLPGLG